MASHYHIVICVELWIRLLCRRWVKLHKRNLYNLYRVSLFWTLGFCSCIKGPACNGCQSKGMWSKRSRRRRPASKGLPEGIAGGVGASPAWRCGFEPRHIQIFFAICAVSTPHNPSSRIAVSPLYLRYFSYEKIHLPVIFSDTWSRIYWLRLNSFYTSISMIESKKVVGWHVLVFP